MISRLMSLVLVMVLFGHTMVQAQSSALQDIQRRLVRYDLEGGDTLQVIRELGRVVQEQQRQSRDLFFEPEPVRQDAQFLRAVVTTDLLLLTAPSNERFVGRIARAYGVDKSQLRSVLTDALSALSTGVYATIARDAHAALNNVSAPRAYGPRSGFTYLKRLSQAAVNNDVPALAALASDPCEEACTAPYHHFRAEGRQAILAVERGLALLEEFSEQAGADPFVAVIAPQLAAIHQTLLGLEIDAQPARGALQVAHVAEVDSAPIGSVIIVHAASIQLATAAHARFSTGSLEIFGTVPSLPLLPETLTVGLPANLRAYPRAIAELVQAMAPLAGASNVVIGGDADAPSHLLTRVWLSAEAATCTPSGLLSAAGDSLQATPVTITREDQVRGLRVHLRLGGHTLVRRGRREQNLPRIRGERGLAFDYASLTAEVASLDHVQLRFMATVPMGALMHTVFRIRPTEPLVLVLP